MQDAARFLTGEHDFTSFRAADCQAKNPIRTLQQLDIYRHADVVHIQAHANAFLHHMVRNIAGVLMTIGAGEHRPSWAKEVLEARDRTVGGITAAPDGLYLVSIAYPETMNIPVVSPVFPQILV
jgi:tRNA pseudouridine38-40 synthase